MCVYMRVYMYILNTQMASLYITKKGFTQKHHFKVPFWVLSKPRFKKDILLVKPGVLSTVHTYPWVAEKFLRCHTGSKYTLDVETKKLWLNLKHHFRWSTNLGLNLKYFRWLTIVLLGICSNYVRIIQTPAKPSKRVYNYHPTAVGNFFLHPVSPNVSLRFMFVLQNDMWFDGGISKSLPVTELISSSLAPFHLHQQVVFIWSSRSVYGKRRLHDHFQVIFSWW